MSVKTPKNERLDAAGDVALIEEFSAQADVSRTTRIKYRAQLGEFQSWLTHPRTMRGAESAPSMCEVKRAEVVRFMSYLAAGDRYASSGHGRVKAELSASTRKSFLASLRNCYKYLVSIDLASCDPTDGVQRPTVKTRPGMRLTAEELRQLLAAPGPPRERVQTFLLAFTAARVNEIRGLRWKDINFPEGTLTLHGKGDKFRVISIHPRLMPELRRWYLIQEQHAARYPGMLEARENPETDFVLMTRNGKQPTCNGIATQLKNRAVRAGLHVLDRQYKSNRSRVTPHALRRTFATLLLNDGHHLDAVADVLGHSSIDTTRKHYAFSSPERRRTTIEGFNV